MRMLAVFFMFVATVASAQKMDVKTFGTSGHPTQALATADGQYVLVTVDTGGGGSGIDVFHDEAGKLKKVAFQSLGGGGAQGILLVPHTQMLAVGLSNEGVAFLPLDDTLRGKAKAQVLPQGDRAGSGYLAVTPDGQYLFVANEYGEGGNIGVIALHRDEAGAIHPATLAHIPTPRATPGVTISKDGTRVYTVGEVVGAAVAERLPGHGIPELERNHCVQANPEKAMPNGVVYVIDVAKAAALTNESTPQDARRAVVALSDAGCSPVREALTADGATLYLTARGDNAVLAFDARKLETDREHAFLRSIPSGGEAPVGLFLFDGGKSMLVANSNRFAKGNGNAAVFDLSDPAKPVLRQTIKTGEFPRNISASPDGSTLYLTVFSGDEVMVLRESK